VKVKYVGPFDEVSVPTPGGTEIKVARECFADFPGELAKELLEQPANWERPPAPAVKRQERTVAPVAEPEGGVTSGS